MSLPAPALEIGDRAPHLTLSQVSGEPFALPNPQLGPATLVWFPFAWRTPAGLCQKLITVAEENNASVVVIPIFNDDELARRGWTYTPTTDGADADAAQAAFPEGGADKAAGAEARGVQAAVPEGGADQAAGAEADGAVLDPALLGEYSVIFHGDGSVTFVMAGVEMPDLRWTPADGGAVIDYFGTAEMRFVPADGGLTLNYFDTLLLTFAK